ncbi:MAG TPA: lactate racemase domain-containing protein [Thermodesulfobacteriota bacterium]|nr:lactate racemase domain-containing protein [Thermodesulfobacteriota bacterium]
MDPLPRVFKIRQKIASPRLGDVEGEMNSLLDRFGLSKKVKPGERVALTAGSRGIRDKAKVLKVIASRLKALGAQPFLVPCMGSHGGATAEGQVKMLHHLGITEEYVGVPIVSSMEVKEIGRTSFGTPVLVDKNICEKADKIVVVNRIKPHTDFDFEVESGISKMIVIGMGKHQGALMAHRLTIRNGFPAIFKEVLPITRKALPFFFGVGIIENQYDQTASLHLLEPQNFYDGEKELLIRARQIMPRLPFKQMDILVVDEIGKNITGAGMDPNVTGRLYFIGSPPLKEPKITRIFARDLTPETQGNAIGIGFADYTTKRLVEKIDPVPTRINSITGMGPECGRIPIAYDRDRDALQDAFDNSGVLDPKELRLVWIKNTLELEYLWAAESMLSEVKKNPNLEVVAPPQEITFDPKGNMVMEWPPRWAD